MIEVMEDLFVGDDEDYKSHVRGCPGWRVVHACKEPYHRNALGYSGRGAPKHHPEYLIAIRDDQLILNLVDAPNPAFFSTEIFDAALKFIRENLQEGFKVLVHCNEGHSRGPGIALLYLAAIAKVISVDSYESAEGEFRRLYPGYSPSRGVRGFLSNNWCRYCG